MNKPPNSTQRPPDSYRHGNLRNAALDEAAALVAVRGGADFSLREIAQRIGVRHTALYRHFASRDALISTLAARAFERMKQRFEEVLLETVADPQSSLDGLLTAYLSMVREEPGAYRVMFAKLTFPDPVRTAASEDCFALLVQTFAQAQNAGLARRDIPAVALASVNWAALHGLAMLIIDERLGDHEAADGCAPLLTALCAVLQDGWKLTPPP